MDVHFTVDLIPGQAGGHPRVENGEFMMIMGTGVTLDAAMRTATTEMSRWLATTYQMTPQEIAPFLGTAMQYEIAEVVDSEYNVVAKLRKTTLAQIRK
jgi:acetamidase/formamidase